MTKHRIALTAGAIAALAIVPALATAHTSAGTATCDAVSVSGANYPRGGSITTVPYLDGVAQPGITTPVTPGGTANATYPWTLQGDHTVRLVQSIMAQDYQLAARQVFATALVCPTAAPPPPPVTPPSPPAQPPTTPTPPGPLEPQGKVVPTCAQLRSVGAGQKWLVKFGCVNSAPPKPRYVCPVRPFPSYVVALRNERRTGKLCRYVVPKAPPSRIPVTG